MSQAKETTLYCDRSETPAKPQWRPTNATKEPLCTYHCKTHSDCDASVEKCVEGDCVDLTCPALTDNGVIRPEVPGKKGLTVGAKAEIACSSGFIVDTPEEGSGVKALELVCKGNNGSSSWVPVGNQSLSDVGCKRGTICFLFTFTQRCLIDNVLFYKAATPAWLIAWIMNCVTKLI